MSKDCALDELRRRAPAVARKLETGATHWRVIPADSVEVRRVIRWIETHFPMQGERIEWSQVPSHECVEWVETADLVDSFARLASGLPRDSEVVVTWADGSCPSLVIQTSELLRVAADVLEADFDTWIVCATENWCLEVHHDGTVCAAYLLP